MSARRPTPRTPREIPSTWAVWLVCTALLAALGAVAVMLYA